MVNGLFPLDFEERCPLPTGELKPFVSKRGFYTRSPPMNGLQRSGDSGGKGDERAALSGGARLGEHLRRMDDESLQLTSIVLQLGDFQPLHLRRLIPPSQLHRVLPVWSQLEGRCLFI